jgi:hypothetical protein
MRRAYGVVFLAVAALAVAGCRKAPKVKATATQDDDVVQVDVTTDVLNDVMVRGEPAPWGEPVKFAALSFPVGAQTIDVQAERRGKKTHIQVPFERKAVPPKLEVVAAKIDPDSGWRCSGFCSGSVKADDDGRVTLVVRAPTGAKVEIAGATTEMALGTSENRVTVDLSKAALDLPIDSVVLHKDGAPPTIDLPAKVTTDSTLDGTVGLPATVFQRALYSKAWDIEKGPIGADGSSTPRTARSLLRLGGTESSRDYFGKSGLRLRDVDLIATTKWIKRTGDDCGPYTNVGMVPHVLHDKEVVVYDRRTGAVRARRTFAASSWCPDTVMADKETLGGVTISETATAETYGSEDAITSWLRSLVSAWGA